jgi:hypothetical protein
MGRDFHSLTLQVFVGGLGETVRSKPPLIFRPASKVLRPMIAVSMVAKKGAIVQVNADTKNNVPHGCRCRLPVDAGQELRRGIIGASVHETGL